MNLKDYIRSIPDYPKKGILFRDITTLIKDENAFEETINQIIERSKKYGLYNNTLFCINYVSKDQIPSLLSKATITTSFFIDIPEMENNSANKFFDGLAAGKPVMINYGGWQSELLNDFGCGFTMVS